MGMKRRSKLELALDRYVAQFDLTNRQAQVLRLLLTGVRQDTVTEVLGITRNTLKRHIEHILIATEGGSISELVERFREVVWGPIR
jgi:DNA-binding CsgD family transcriptional regulator